MMMFYNFQKIIEYFFKKGWERASGGFGTIPSRVEMT